MFLFLLKSEAVGRWALPQIDPVSATGNGGTPQGIGDGAVLDP